MLELLDPTFTKLESLVLASASSVCGADTDNGDDVASRNRASGESGNFMIPFASLWWRCLLLFVALLVLLCTRSWSSEGVRRLTSRRLRLAADQIQQYVTL